MTFVSTNRVLSSYQFESWKRNSYQRYLRYKERWSLLWIDGFVSLDAPFLNIHSFPTFLPASHPSSIRQPSFQHLPTFVMPYPPPPGYFHPYKNKLHERVGNFKTAVGTDEFFLPKPLQQGRGHDLFAPWVMASNWFSKRMDDPAIHDAFLLINASFAEQVRKEQLALGNFAWTMWRRTFPPALCDQAIFLAADNNCLMDFAHPQTLKTLGMLGESIFGLSRFRGSAEVDAHLKMLGIEDLESACGLSLRQFPINFNNLRPLPYNRNTYLSIENQATTNRRGTRGGRGRGYTPVPRTPAPTRQPTPDSLPPLVSDSSSTSKSTFSISSSKNSSLLTQPPLISPTPSPATSTATSTTAVSSSTDTTSNFLGDLSDPNKEKMVTTVSRPRLYSLGTAIRELEKQPRYISDPRLRSTVPRTGITLSSAPSFPRVTTF